MILFTFRCASCNVLSTSALYVSSTFTIEIPSCEVDVILFTPSKALTASSIFVVTEFSTSLGEAPGYTVLIEICGDVIFGNNS